MPFPLCKTAFDMTTLNEHEKKIHNLRLINIDDDTNEKPVQSNQSQTLNGK